MPELPEVETTIRGLRPIIGSTIISIKINTPKLRFLIPKNIIFINAAVIEDIKRKGKFIIINLNNNYSLILHLGMSGRIRLFNTIKFQKNKHDHFLFKTNKNFFFVFNDPRKFGFIDCVKTSTLSNQKYFINLGKEPLEKSTNANYFFSKISKSIVPIKQILLNQKIIAGIGNIYASEILFDARISPLVRGKDINIEDCKKIIISMRKILNMAINSGGSSFRDYVSTDGTIGNFQTNFKVYNREGGKIFGAHIKKITQYGRSTYYCPELQKKIKKRN